MNILFLIGNGFDLNLGLNTKFKDVIDEYLQIKTGDTNITKFQEEFKDHNKSWSDFEKALGEYTIKFTSKNIDDFIFQIQSFHDVLIKKLSNEENRIDYERNIGDIFSKMQKSLIAFNDYLDDEGKQEISSLLSTDRVFNYNFISFNYTSVFDKCLVVFANNISSLNTFQISRSINAIVHIHGTLQKDLILGVDNTDQIANTELSEDENFHWKIIKPIMNKELGSLGTKKSKMLIDKSQIICIFGMSIGETDKTWWEYIFDWLSENNSRHLVIFYHIDIDEMNPIKKIENKKRIKDLFFFAAGQTHEESIKKCADRIHIANSGDMFKMDILSLK